MIIEVRPSKKFKDARFAFEAPGVEPAFGSAPVQSAKRIDYPCRRFGRSTGEMHVYEESGKIVERKVAIDGRGQYPQARR